MTAQSSNIEIVRGIYAVPDGITGAKSGLCVVRDRACSLIKTF